MKTRITVVFLGLALIALPLPAFAEPAVPNAPWIDDFDGPTLDSRWFWLNENPAYWSLTAQPGFMRLIAQQGWTNILLQASPTGAFAIETRLLFEPTQNIQRAGLVVIQDGDNQLWLTRAYCDYGPPGCPGNAIYFDRSEDGAGAGSNFATTTASSAEAYLRVVRQGREYSGYYSEDGVHWSLVGTHVTAADFAPVAIGLAANYTPLGAGEIAADFDYFKLDSYAERVMLPLIYR